MSIEERLLPLQSAYRHESERPDTVYMTQPMGGPEIRTYTWKQTLDEARRMATYLKAQGYPEGSRIAMLSKNCSEFIIGEMAIWMAGYVTVALFPTLDAKTVSYILEHSEASMLFVGKLDVWDEMKPGVPEDLPKVSFTLAPPNDYKKWSDCIAESEPIEGSPLREGSDTSMIIYTSGSTGQPKGVEITFNNLGFTNDGIQRVFDLKSNDRLLSYLPLAHSFERMAVENLSIYTGCELYFAEALTTFVEDLKRARPTLFISVPRLWLKFQMGVFKKMPPKKLRTFLKIPILKSIVKKKLKKGLGLDATRFAISGSAPIPPDLVQWYRDIGLELLEGYGMTENIAFSHCNQPGKTRVGYVGNPFPGVEHKIDDNGEILVRSPATMKGYYKAPEETKEAITEDGWLRTGDRGEIDDMDRLRITGRVKELFKTSKGKYVAPVPLENDLNNDFHIELSCVFGSGYPQPCAVVQLAEDLRPKMNDKAFRDEVTAAFTKLREDINKEVPVYERLQFVAVAKDEWLIENGYLTPTMKIKRNILEDTYGPQLDDWYGSKQPVVWEE